jgi:L-alanine-DL-glutamate epimerase-like enolase superfamily enzyme
MEFNTPTIAEVNVYPVGVPITRGFTFASGSAGGAGGTAGLLLVKVVDNEGNVGWGQSRPVPSWSYETIESAVSTVRNYLAPALIGLNPWDRMGAHARMFARIGRGPSNGMPIAKAAVDLALHDLLGRITGQPLRALLGGDVNAERIELSWTCTAHKVEEIEADVDEGLSLGLRHFNFKAAVEPSSDIALARKLSTLVPAGSFLWADCNQGFSLPDAVRVAAAFEEIGVDLLEQPLPADQPHLMEALRSRTKLALAVDESSVSAGDFFAYASRGLVDYLVLKLPRSAGVWPSTLQLATAQSAGLSFVVSGLADGLLTKVASAQVAAAYGGTRPMALNGSQFLDESALFPDKASWEKDGAVHLDHRCGIGPVPDEAAIHRHLLSL